jgi:Zn-dependent metalloprotease
MTNCACRNPFHCILPPHILDRLAKSGNAKLRNAAVEQMRSAATFRAVRTVANAYPDFVLAAPKAAKSAKAAPRPNRLVYSQGNRTPAWTGLPGTLKRKEGQAPVSDPAVNEAYNHAGSTWKFYYDVFARNSIDDMALPLVSSVHAGVNFNNAFWEGAQMVYGDGDGVLFRRFTRSLDVIGHEMTHGVVQHTSGLVYEAQSGALNEHFADVFGVLVRMYKGNVKARTTSSKAWLVGADLFVPAPTRKALRSLKAPGTAYVNDPDLGTDPQPQHMDNYLDLPVTQAGDWGGVHINSGIPNKAFYLAATALGGYAWETAGKVWYEVMKNLQPHSQFADAAAQCRTVSKGLYGSTSAEAKAIDKAWTQVGL